MLNCKTWSVPYSHSPEKIDAPLYLSKLTILLLVLACSACNSEKAGMKELKRLCDKDAGLKIYRTVEAAGYYDAYTDCHHCWNELIRSNYRFVEFCAVEDRDPLSYILADKGCYRITKVKRDHNTCHLRVDQRLSEFRIHPFPEFLKEYCITIEKMKKPEAEYSYDEDLEIWREKNGVSEFIRSRAWFEDRGNREVISEYISYSYNKRPGHTSPKSCRILDKKFSISIKTDFIGETIKSNKEKLDD